MFHVLFDVFPLILTKICDRNINITCLFIVLVFEEKVNEILTYYEVLLITYIIATCTCRSLGDYRHRGGRLKTYIALKIKAVGRIMTLALFP